MTITVYLVDDHPQVREALMERLQDEPDIEVVGQAGTAKAAIAELLLLSPDVAVLDVRLPDGSGIDICRWVRSQLPALRCFMLTSYDDDNALLAALMAGASGFLLKGMHGVNVAGAIRQVHAGGSLINPQTAQDLLVRVRQQLDMPSQQMFTLLGAGMTDAEIGRELGVPTVEAHSRAQRLLTKIGVGRWR